MSDFLKKMKENLDNGDLSNLDEVKKMNKIHNMVETEQYKKGELDKLKEKQEPLTKDQIEGLDSFDDFNVEPNKEEEKLKKFASIMNTKLRYMQLKEELNELGKVVDKEKDSFISEYGVEEFNKIRDLNL